MAKADPDEDIRPELMRKRPYELTIGESACRPYHYDLFQPFLRFGANSLDPASISVGKRYQPKPCRYEEVRHLPIISDDITMRAPRHREYPDIIRTVVFEISHEQSAQVSITVPENFGSMAQWSTVYFDSAKPEPVCVPLPPITKARMQQPRDDFYLEYPERHPDGIEKKKKRSDYVTATSDERHRADEEYTREYDWQPKLRVTKQFPHICYRYNHATREREAREWVFECRGTTSKTAGPIHPPEAANPPQEAPPIPKTPSIAL